MKTNIRFEKRDLRIIACFLFLLPFLSFAQKDTVKVSFSEETVEKFEKTNILDEYDKAFGGNRVVKSGLRVALIRPYTKSDNSTVGIFYEKKVGNEFSIISSIRGSTEKNSKFNIGVEGRWYYQMKKKVENESKKPNITGNYIGIRWQYTPFWVPEFQNIYMTVYTPAIEKFNYREKNNFSIVLGKQFGNNVDFGLAVGFKRGFESYVNQQNYWVNDLNSPRRFNPYITTYSQVGVGFMFPRKTKTINDYCGFLNCSYNLKQMFKWNLNNAFYLDKFQQSFQIDVAYERKIGNSPFSLNSNIWIYFNRIISKLSIGRKDSIFMSRGREIKVPIWLFSNEKEIYNNWNYEISQQLRYYVGMKNRVLKGKTGNNLNGFYIGGVLSYQSRGLIRTKSQTSQSTNNFYFFGRNTWIFGGTIGVQNKVSKSTFIDFGINAGFQTERIPIFNPNTYNWTWSENKFNHFNIQPYLKLGFAK